MNDDEPQTPAQAVQVALAAMLEYAQAFGMSKREAEKVFNAFTRSIAKAPAAATADLLDDLLSKWVPAAQRVRRS